ncbi:IPT/TIG domain-containing protein [Draconibacterium orientale]|uniref:IPT/TIG domain-containing protein n=1 Tax=Draconibacterium orientale TaxID=1168034 RepID=UPI002ABDE42B|nr:IPT/TIG domain-containing protein [Draconibacterium orientale]
MNQTFTSKLRRRLLLLLAGIVPILGLMISCDKDDNLNMQEFDPAKEIEITEFYPDSGGIATPIIIEGSNFGADTTGLRVFFKDSLGVRHQAGLVGSNGNKIYAMVPKLTYLKKLNIIVERTDKDAGNYTGTAEDHFIYKTETTVSTVVGKPEPDNNSMPTVGGDFSSATLSAPFAIVLDDEDNIFITERSFYTQSGYSGQSARNEKGEGVQSNLVIADTKAQTATVMLYGADFTNAPTFSGEAGNESVYMPEDAGLYFYQLPKSLSYAPRRRSLITGPESKDVIEGNWKYSFVSNKEDNMIYSVMWKGQLVRFNPSTRNVEVLLDKIIPDIPNARGQSGCNTYCIFSPTEPNMLYFAMEEYNMIGRVDVSKLADKDKATYKGEAYAGRSFIEGPVNGRGWEDGLLENARFLSPKQICFTTDGKLYIADSGNHCIRVIDTTAPKDKATVNTAIGLPQSPGFRDGGPEIAKFYHPTGVAVNADGSIVYVADHRNKVIRKLSIE